MTIRQALVTGQGETFTLNIQYTDSNGTPVDLTGHSVDLILKKAGSGTVIGTYAATVDDSGNIAIAVEDEVTDLWPVGKSAYIVRHTSPDGVEKWLCYGPLTVVNAADV